MADPVKVLSVPPVAARPWQRLSAPSCDEARVSKPSIPHRTKPRRHVSEAVDDYGDVTLRVPLPDESWDTSVALWFGDRWHCCWSIFGPSRRVEATWFSTFCLPSGYRFSVHLVYVP